MGDNLNITTGFLRSVEALLETLELDADKASPSVEGRADQCIIRLGAIDDEPLVAPQPVAADDLA